MAAGDPYVYPGTDVLRNVQGLRDHDQLTALEVTVTTLALAGLEATRLPGQYDLTHLQAFHREVFAEVCPWAGELRTVAISKPGAVFCLPQHLTSYANEVLGRLADACWLRDTAREVFLDGLSALWADLNSLHPFREGNGRSARAFLRQLSADAGWPLSWAGLDARVNLHASVAAHQGDNAPMRALLDRHIAPRLVLPRPGRAGAATAVATAATSYPTPLSEALSDAQPPLPGHPGDRPPPRRPPPRRSRGR